MTPEVHPALEQLKDLLETPVVYNALILIAIGLIPQSLLDKLPILGKLISLFKSSLAAQTAKQEAKKANAGAVIAGNLVEGFEQLKQTGRVDATTAAQETTRIIADKTGLSPELSRVLTEQAVRQMNKDKLFDKLAAQASERGELVARPLKAVQVSGH